MKTMKWLPVLAKKEVLEQIHPLLLVAKGDVVVAHCLAKRSVEVVYLVVWVHLAEVLAEETGFA